MYFVFRNTSSSGLCGKEGQRTAQRQHHATAGQSVAELRKHSSEIGPAVGEVVDVVELSVLGGKILHLGESRDPFWKGQQGIVVVFRRRNDHARDTGTESKAFVDRVFSYRIVFH